MTGANTFTLDTNTYALTNQTMYIGTTAVAINRTTGALALTGITSIDGTATNLSGTPALPNGTTATTQSANNNSTKLATTAYVDAQPASALKSATTTVNVSSATAPTNGQVLTATSGTAATWQTPSGGTSFIPQEFLFSSGTTLYSANGGLVYAFDASGNLFVAIVNGTTTCTLYRYGKTSIGIYNFTNSTTLTITSGTYVGIVVIGSYLYVNCSISSTGALCRYNIADLTGVTTMTVSSSNVYGLQGGVPPYAFNDGTGTNIYVGYGGQSYFYMATISGTTVTYNSQITYTSLPFSLGCAVANGSYMWMISGGNVLKWAITGGAEVSSTPCSTYLANGLNLYSGTILEVVSTFNYYTGTTVTGIGIKLNAMPLP